MPHKLVWTDAQDFTIRRMRAEASTWEHIATVMGLHRYTVIQRGRRLGAERPALSFETPPEDLRREALPAGHPQSWQPITSGTLLDGCVYPLPCFEG